MKRCIVEWDANRLPTFKSMTDETIGYCDNLSITHSVGDMPQMVINMLVVDNFFAKLSEDEILTKEPIINIQTEQFEYRAIDVS